MNSKGQFIIITGAGGGIGKELVCVFREAGYGIIAVDRNPLPDGVKADHFVQPDLQKTVKDEGHARHVFAGIRNFLDGRPLKALVNNAAVQLLAATDDLSRNAWQETLDVNLLAPFFWAQAFLEELEASGGCVVNMSSIHANLTKPQFVAYATSKAALSGMTRAMAVDLGSRVRVNAIEPAAIATEMLVAGFEGKDELYRQLEEFHPSMRIGRPTEVARLALAMVDGELGFLHGACIALHGGIGVRLHDPD